MRVVDVALRAFQHLRGKASRLGDDLVAGAIDRGSRDRGRARAPGAVAERDAIGVAFDEIDILDRQAQAIGGDLAERDLVPLPMGMAAGEDGHLAVAVDAHDGALPAAMQAATFGEIAARPGTGLVNEGG